MGACKKTLETKEFSVSETIEKLPERQITGETRPQVAPPKRWRNKYFWNGPASERGLYFVNYDIHWKKCEIGERLGACLWPSFELAEQRALELIARHPNKTISWLGAIPEESA